MKSIICKGDSITEAIMSFDMDTPVIVQSTESGPGTRALWPLWKKESERRDETYLVFAEAYLPGAPKNGEEYAEDELVRHSGVMITYYWGDKRERSLGWCVKPEVFAAQSLLEPEAEKRLMEIVGTLESSMRISEDFYSTVNTAWQNRTKGTDRLGVRCM